MVILYDLEEVAIDGIAKQSNGLLPRAAHGTSTAKPTNQQFVPTGVANSALFAALRCYPVVAQIAKHLDLNSLDDLSRTCRTCHSSLLEHRAQLLRQTLRCSNEDVALSVRLADRIRGARQAWRSPQGSGNRTDPWSAGRMTSGRVGSCARDMVGECRRCNAIVCRNCTVKQPPTQALTQRHRRLCRTCIAAPALVHTSSYASATTNPDPNSRHPIFTAPAFARGPCTCPEAVFLCLSCGNALRSADTTYMRGWTWRTRYSTYLGGLGTGIGEGNEGVECGRGERCLGAKEVEVEIDCDAEALAEMRRDAESERGSAGRGWGGASYLAQEIEGIGGVVKRKVKKRVKVGEKVKEYEDERESGDYLGREREGVNRSWCCWCSRIILGRKDEGQDLV